MVEAPQPVRSFLDRYDVLIDTWSSLIRVEATTQEDGQARLARGLPWVEAAALDPAPLDADKVLDELLSELRASAASNRAVLERIREALDSRKLIASALLRAVLDRDGAAVDRLAEGVGVPTLSPDSNRLTSFFRAPVLSSSGEKSS